MVVGGRCRMGSKETEGKDGDHPSLGLLMIGSIDLNSRYSDWKTDAT